LDQHVIWLLKQVLYFLDELRISLKLKKLDKESLKKFK
jgi:hypothetical protein